MQHLFAFESYVIIYLVYGLGMTYKTVIFLWETKAQILLVYDFSFGLFKLLLGCLFAFLYFVSHIYYVLYGKKKCSEGGKNTKLFLIATLKAT